MMEGMTNKNSELGDFSNWKTQELIFCQVTMEEEKRRRHDRLLPHWVLLFEFGIKPVDRWGSNFQRKKIKTLHRWRLER